jgi:hypothetical protein
MGTKFSIIILTSLSSLTIERFSSSSYSLY